MRLSLGILLVCVRLVVGQVKQPANTLFAQGEVDDVLGASGHKLPGIDLASVKQGNYTSLTHSAFPEHTVRITRVHHFCDTTVKVYSGYVDVEARHLFFSFFESRSDPVNDDVVMWINGGPGGSSGMGLLMEIGPCNIQSANRTTTNPYAWNTNANLIFLDQPIGVGFSYADHGETVYTSEEAAKDVAAFFAILLNTFPQFNGRALHMAGESYAGHYLPIFAAEVYDQNQRLVELGLLPVNLNSIILVNGWTDMYILTESFYDIQCTDVSGLPPVMSIDECVRIKQTLPHCLKMLRKSCHTNHDQMSCSAASRFCHEELLGSYFNSGRNVYDMSKECEGEMTDTLCYPQTKLITAFLNSSAARTMLNTDSRPLEYKISNVDVGLIFRAAGDPERDTMSYVGQLLDRGVRVLVVAGAYDLVCNWIGNERVSRALEWYGQNAFGAQPLGEWGVEGKTVGKMRSWGPLTFASVYAAGHMAAHDKPKETLVLLQGWLGGKVL